jgi:hypothetical protein
MKHKIACVFLSLAFLAVYAGLYFALVDFPGRVPQYHRGGDAAKVIFWPINQLDRLIRPNYWSKIYQ